MTAVYDDDDSDDDDVIDDDDYDNDDHGDDKGKNDDNDYNNDDDDDVDDNDVDDDDHDDDVDTEMFCYIVLVLAWSSELAFKLGADSPAINHMWKTANHLPWSLAHRNNRLQTRSNIPVK